MTSVTLDVSGWLNGPELDLVDLRGRVVMVEAFQMLCPGCVSHGLPQAQRVHRAFPRDEVVVIGLHTVFEHHHAMGPDALTVFLSEYRIEFPIAIDRHDDSGPIPVTMARYQLQGTPSTLLIDRQGQLSESIFGPIDDLILGTHIGRLLTAPSASPPVSDPGPASGDAPTGACTDEQCQAPPHAD